MATSRVIQPPTSAMIPGPLGTGRRMRLAGLHSLHGHLGSSPPVCRTARTARLPDDKQSVQKAVSLEFLPTHEYDTILVGGKPREARKVAGERPWLMSEEKVPSCRQSSSSLPRHLGATKLRAVVRQSPVRLQRPTFAEPPWHPHAGRYCTPRRGTCATWPHREAPPALAARVPPTSRPSWDAAQLSRAQRSRPGCR